MRDDKENSNNSDDNNDQRKIHREPIATLLAHIESLFGATAAKATLADYVRLIQLETDLFGEELPGKVVVQWLDPIPA